jgi:flavorubredoxin
MENMIKQLSDEVLGIAVWSSEWNTYINCYILRDGEGFFLIDTINKDNGKELLNLLSSVNIDKSNINTVIATHGHGDHIGNINLFENASKFIHNNDITIAQKNEQECYKVLHGERGILFEFEWMLLGGHTPGSMVLYHKKTKTLFAGDYICFFGFPLPQDGLISEGLETRDFWLEFITSGELSNQLQSQNINPLDVARGIQTLGVYDTEYLCTGHGVILKHNVPSFLNRLSEEIIKYEKDKLNYLEG